MDTKTAVQAAKPGMTDGSPYVMPAVVTLMVMIAAVFYVKTAQTDVDRYPTCFVVDCRLPA